MSKSKYSVMRTDGKVGNYEDISVMDGGTLLKCVSSSVYEPKTNEFEDKGVIIPVNTIDRIDYIEYLDADDEEEEEEEIEMSLEED